MVLLGCSDGKPHMKIPKDIIPVDTMINVMADLKVMEVAVRQNFPQSVGDTSFIERSGDTILDNYHLKFDRYQRSLKYYLFYQDTMNYIYDQMFDKITLQLNEMKH